MNSTSSSESPKKSKRSLHGISSAITKAIEGKKPLPPKTTTRHETEITETIVSPNSGSFSALRMRYAYLLRDAMLTLTALGALLCTNCETDVSQCFCVVDNYIETQRVRVMTLVTNCDED